MARCGGSLRSCGKKHRSSVAPPRGYVVRDTSPCPRLGKTLRNVDFRRLTLLKGHGSTPSLQSLINVGHRQQAVFPLTRTFQWLFGDWGRAGRGV